MDHFQHGQDLQQNVFQSISRNQESHRDGHFKQHKQSPAAVDSVNVTYLSTKAGENTTEIVLQ